MRRKTAFFAAVAWLVAGLASTPADEPAAKKSYPPFSELRKAVLGHFEAKDDFQTNDLITRENVAPLLAKLKKQGFPIADEEAILKRLPAQGDWIVAQWKTPDGRAFLRRTSSSPLAYDRFDRLGATPQGRKAVANLRHGYSGTKVVEYMTTKGLAKELGKQLSNTATGDEFNTPTGRIYTVPMLLDRLQQSYDAALKPAPAKEKRSR